MKTKRDIQADVIFRVFKSGGDVIAFWPANNAGDYCCQSYQHVGQHGAADYQHCLSITRPATLKEYDSLLKELKDIGYTPNIIKRCTKEHEKVRMSFYS